MCRARRHVIETKLVGKPDKSIEPRFRCGFRHASKSGASGLDWLQGDSMTSDADTTELEPPHLDPERIRDADDQLSSAWLQRLRQRLGDGDKLALEELTAPL